MNIKFLYENLKGDLEIVGRIL